jgi:hypothetical protein
MNKNYLQYALILLFTYMSPSFAMGGNVFKLTRLVGVTTLPAYGLYKANKAKNDAKEYVEGLEIVEECPVKNWFDEEKKKLDIPSLETVSLVKSPDWMGCEWAANNNVVIIDRNRKNRLNDMLLGDLEEEKNIYLKTTIPQNAMVLKHEFGHIVYKDGQNTRYALAIIPVGIELLSFGATTAFRKLFNVQNPKTLLQSRLRSCCSIGAIVPKMWMGSAAFIVGKRYQEYRADKFACEHAESRLELEEFAKYFKTYEFSDSDLETWIKRGFITQDEAIALKNKSNMQLRWEDFKKDKNHPARIDRVEMIEGYIDQWDRDHSYDAEKRA